MLFKKKKKEAVNETPPVVNDNGENLNVETPPPSPTVKVESKKKTKRNIFRVILIVLNASLACYLLYYLSDAIVDFYNTHFNQNNSPIYLLNGMSQDESMKKYNEAISKDEKGNFITEDVYDYYIYGGYLHFSKEPNIRENEHFSTFETYTLRELTGDITYSTKLVFSQAQEGLNYGIPLFDSNLKEGDYIVYPYAWKGEENKVPLKINSEQGIEITLYSSIQNGSRKVINILSKTSSPALLISIRKTSALKASYHDVAVLYNDEQEKEDVRKLFTSETQMDMIQKKDKESDNLIALYESKALVNIIIDEGDEIRLSHYLTLEEDINITKDETLSEGKLKGQDKDIYIRELGGYGFYAGEGYNSDNQILYPYKGEHDLGRLTLRVGKNRLNDLPKLLTLLLNFTF